MHIKMLLKLFKLTVNTSTDDKMPEQVNFCAMLIWRYGVFRVSNVSLTCSVSFNSNVL